MDTFTVSRRAVVAMALGLAMSLSLVGCSRVAGIDAPSEAVRDATNEPSAPPSPANPSPSPLEPSSPTPTRTPGGGPTATSARFSDAPSALVGCLLWQSHGNLVAENGRPVFRTLQSDIPPDPVPLDVPDGWEIRATDGGQFEVLDGNGVVRATTGTRVIVLSDADPNTPGLNADGALVVCAMDSYPPWMYPDSEDAP
jgi:hypothetical protein